MHYVLTGEDRKDQMVADRDYDVVDEVRQAILDRVIELSQWKPGDELMAPLATLTGDGEVVYYVLAEFFPTLKAEFESIVVHCHEQEVAAPA